MAKGKLLTALDRQKGRDIRLERQRQQEKKAAKKRAEKEPAEEELDEDEEVDEDEDEDGDEDEDDAGTQQGGVPLSASIAALAKGIAADEAAAAADAMDADEDEDEEDEDEDPEADEIPFSDLESLGSDDKADVVPFQRLTINNTAALLKAHRAIAADRSAPFAVHQTVTSAAQTEIKDVHDDLGRELAFYKQCLEAATEGRARLQKESVPFTRPADYFAETVKTDEHMSKIRAQLTEKANDKKAAAEARKLRDLRKFGKQVQVAKQQERDKAKRATLDKINQLKRKRNASGGGTGGGDTREEDLFDVALEDAAEKPAKKRDRRTSGDGPPNHRRQHKNDKYGFGGKKRFKKSGDAVSSGDLSGFNARKMKGQTKGSKRPGKSRRAKLS